MTQFFTIKRLILFTGCLSGVVFNYPASATTYVCQTMQAYGFQSNTLAKEEANNILSTVILNFDDESGILYADVKKFGPKSSEPIKMNVLHKMTPEDDLVAISNKINNIYMFFLRISRKNNASLLYTRDNIFVGSCTIDKQ